MRHVLDCTTGSLQAYTNFPSGFFELEITLEHYFPEDSKIMTEIIRAVADNFYESPDFHGLGCTVRDGGICERESVRKHGAEADADLVAAQGLVAADENPWTSGGARPCAAK